MNDLRRFTAARVALGRAGNSLPTREVLAFALAHAKARDAVHFALDVPGLLNENESAIVLESAAQDRAEYLRRPDLGRRLSQASKSRLASIPGPFDVAFTIADGLSALAIHNHALAVLAELKPLIAETWNIAPLTIVRFGRVAIADEIGSALNAALSIILIGERPGLSSSDSLGVYLTWNPRLGRLDSERNCISNIHSGGLRAKDAARLLAVLMNESRTRKLSGIDLKAPSLNSLTEPEERGRRAYVAQPRKEDEYRAAEDTASWP